MLAREALKQNQSKRALGKSREGGFFLKKKPLEGMASGYSYSGFAIAVPIKPANATRASAP
jgi:hypothetical protein